MNGRPDRTGVWHPVMSYRLSAYVGDVMIMLYGDPAHMNN